MILLLAYADKPIIRSFFTLTGSSDGKEMTTGPENVSLIFTSHGGPESDWGTPIPPMPRKR